jgi:hypothetical protein
MMDMGVGRGRTSAMMEGETKEGWEIEKVIISGQVVNVDDRYNILRSVETRKFNRKWK